MFDQLLAEASKPNVQLDIAKIVIEKGLLAIILAGFALAAAILVERIKASLSRQQEILKITGPLVLKLLESCEALYESGMSTLRSKSREFADYEHWAVNLTSVSVRSIETMAIADIPHGPDARNATLEIGVSSISLVDHLKAHAPTTAIADLVDTDLFWQQEAVVSQEGSLVRHLYLAYMANSATTVNAVHFQMARTFSACKLGRSKEYTAALFKFRQELIGTLYPGNAKQLKAIRGLLKLLEHNSSAFEDFPALDIGRARVLGASNMTTTFEILAQNHAKMVGLIGQYLRSH